MLLLGSQKFRKLLAGFKSHIEKQWQLAFLTMESPAAPLPRANSADRLKYAPSSMPQAAHLGCVRVWVRYSTVAGKVRYSCTAYRYCTGIIVLPDGSRLFAGSDRGDFEEGLPQGSPESSLAFCVLIQEAVQELHEALAGGGGGATFIMDDGYRLYCYGRSEEVLPAIRRFADRLTDLGLHLQFGKCSFYSPRTLPSVILAELDALGISPGGVRRTPEGAEATQTEVHFIQPFLPGITVGGVPLGHEAFIRQYMSTLAARAL